MAIAKQIVELVNGQVKKAVGFGVRRPFLQRQANNLAAQVRKRTRLGRGVERTGPGRVIRLARLADSTKEQRQRYSFNLSPLTTPRRSNLTATGQMLDSLYGDVAGNTLLVRVRDQIKRKLSGGPSKVRISDVIDFTEDGSTNRPARPFFRAAEFEREEISRNIRKEIFRGLNL